MKRKTKDVGCHHSCVFAYCPDSHENCVCRTCLVKVMCIDSCNIRRDLFKLDYDMLEDLVSSALKIKGEENETN